MDEEIIEPVVPILETAIPIPEVSIPEVSIPVQRMSLKHIAKEVNPTIETAVSEDALIAQLYKQKGWEALKERILRKIETIENNTKIDANSIGLIDDIQLYGFKCMAKDLLVEAYQSIINDVEMTAKFLKEQEKDEQVSTDEKS